MTSSWPSGWPGVVTGGDRTRPCASVNSQSWLARTKRQVSSWVGSIHQHINVKLTPNQTVQPYSLGMVPQGGVIVDSWFRHCTGWSGPYSFQTTSSLLGTVFLGPPMSHGRAILRTSIRFGDCCIQASFSIGSASVAKTSQ